MNKVGYHFIYNLQSIRTQTKQKLLKSIKKCKDSTENARRLIAIASDTKLKIL